MDYMLWLCFFSGLTLSVRRKALSKYVTPECVFNSGEYGNCTTEALDKARRLLDKCYRKNMYIITYNDYGIQYFNDLPLVLFCMGQKLPKSPRTAIVGTREPDDRGIAAAREYSAYLAKHNVSVISGMALGIDTYAHTAALENDGFTAAFLAHGLDMCYPRANKRLMDMIAEKGVLLSEYPPETTPERYRFPARDRLIAAFSDVTAVIEAGERSGALITANYAEKYHKDIYALPGPLENEKSIGCNRLIAENKATAISSPSDLIPKKRYT